MADTDRIKRNIGKMIDAGAPEADIDAYLSSEGFKSAEDFRTGKRAAAPVQAQGRSDAAANAFGQGATLGLGDELAATVRAALPGFSNWMMQRPFDGKLTAGPVTNVFTTPDDPQRGVSGIKGGETLYTPPQPSPPQTVSTAPTYDQRYSDELTRQRGQTAADAKAYPVMTTGANVAGTLATAGALSFLPGGQTLLGGGATSLPGAMVRGAASGAVLGGTQGFGEGEGGFDQRLKSAGTGAAVGGVVGGVLPAVGSGVGYLYEKFAPGALRAVGNVADKFTTTAPARSGSAAAPEGGMVTQNSLAATIADNSRIAAGNIEGDAAAKRLALEIARSGGSTQARQRLADLGEGAFLADTSKGTTRLANLGAILPGEAGEKYTAAFGQRNRETGQRFLGAMGDQANVPSIHDTRRFLEARRTTDSPTTPFGESAEGIYARARDAGLNISPQMQRLLDENPIVRQAFDRVTRENAATRLGTDRAPLDPVNLMHQTKQAIVDIATATTTGGNPTQRAYRDLADDFVRSFKEANPAVRAADARYREMKSLYDNVSGEGWLTHGQNFMKTGNTDAAIEVSPSALADYIPRLTQEQLQAFRVGAANTMRDAATSGPESTRRLAKSIADNQIMQQKLTEIYGPEVADRLMKRATAERAFAETQNKVLQGSQTAERLASMADEAALSIPQGGATTPASLVQAVLNGYAKARQPSEAVRSRLADLLANPDPRANAETLALIDAILKQQGAARPFNAGISGAAGGGFASSPR